MALRRGEVADDADLRVAGQAQVGLDDDASGAVERRAGALRQGATERRGGNAGGPDDAAARQVLGARRGARVARHFVAHAFGIDVRHLAAGAHLDVQPLELLARALREPRHEGGEHALPAFQQHHARLPRIDAAELARQRVLRHLRQGARHLDAGRPGADDDEGHPGGAFGRIARALGLLEGADDAGASGEGVGQRLQPRRDRGPFVVSEVAVRGAGGDDQVVVGESLAVVERDRMRRRIDGDDLGLQHGQVAALRLVAQDVADRRGDRRRREARARDLVEQRLEQVVVGAVDQRDLDLGLRQRAHRLDAAEAAADDDDVRPRAHRLSPVASPVASIWRRTRLMWLRSAYSSSV